MNYDENDKLDMVLEVLRHPKQASEIASRNGIAISTLYKWRSRFLQGGREELRSLKTGPKQSVVSDSEREKDQKIQDYEQRISELSADLEIAKKKENWPLEESSYPDELKSPRTLN